MSRKIIFILICVWGVANLTTGCSTTSKNDKSKDSVYRIQQIDSFRPDVACSQGLEVMRNNTYSQTFFEDVFARIIMQSKKSKSAQNPDIIWDNFVTPLRKTGKVPDRLAVSTWNYYFSSVFVSLPEQTTEHYCYMLPAIKDEIEKEYQMKLQGFEAADQGSPDSHFINAMHVYNTMWAVCNPMK